MSASLSLGACVDLNPPWTGAVSGGSGGSSGSGGVGREAGIPFAASGGVSGSVTTAGVTDAEAPATAADVSVVDLSLPDQPLVTPPGTGGQQMVDATIDLGAGGTVIGDPVDTGAGPWGMGGQAGAGAGTGGSTGVGGATASGDGGKRDAGSGGASGGGASGRGGSPSATGGRTSSGGSGGSISSGSGGASQTDGSTTDVRPGTGGTGVMAGASGGLGGATGAGGSTSIAVCAGVPGGGVCWYLGGAGLSCSEVCASHGGVSSNAAAFVGTPAQGGSSAECEAILKLLGQDAAPSENALPDGMGFGCCVYAGATWWLTAPDFSATAKLADLRLVCGCNS